MPAETSPAHDATILVVDDLPANLELVARHLEHQGYRVTVAQAGDEAIERAVLVRPALILLDVMMPGIDGFETCRRLKAHEDLREIPVIFMSARVETGDKLIGFSSGAVDYVAKPVDSAELLARVETHLALAALRRQLSAQNLQLRREIAAREEVQEALKRSNAELEQLAYVASHDMQEPLRMIASYLQLVAKRYHDQLDANGQEFIGFAVDGAKRMQALINDMLAYSRLGTKARPLAPVDAADAVQLALQHLRVAMEESGAQVACGVLPTVLGDAPQLVQLLQNLVGNAIKFRGGTAPQIRIDCVPDDAGWCFSVRDNGIGIAPEFGERIFVMFQRLHGRDAYPGTGIGLALCKRIVERHGGRIWVEPAEGGGSVFRFTLPRA
ncbi:sensor histidine kinase [Aquabacterium sp.]|uniref:sensor histidine kinase n=1 Tax=Aquabacterium sp. TaxID=1872578 RepID=UPI002CDEF583|nr:ATP-binding protein [Aquabacterium sp.]HSW08306.1 ATP-binding protein [Aquabacterium sp.]